MDAIHPSSSYNYLKSISGQTLHCIRRESYRLVIKDPARFNHIEDQQPNNGGNRRHQL